MSNVTRFADDEGNPSSMRLMCFMSLVTAIVLSVAALFVNSFPTELVIYFLGAAMGGKVGQKFAEVQAKKSS